MSNTPSTEELEITLEQAKVLRVMIEWDYTWFGYSKLSLQTGILEPQLKKMMKEMSTLGWVEYIKGLLNDDGEVAGSGWFIKYPFEYHLRDALRAYEIEAPDNWKVVEAWRTIKNWTVGKHHEVTAAVNILLEIERKRTSAQAQQEAVERERSRIDKLMNRFEKTNRKRTDKIAGWYWLRSQLREALQTKGEGHSPKTTGQEEV